MAFLRSTALALSLAACSGGGDASDAGEDAVYGHHYADAATFEAEAAPKVPWKRLTFHGGGVLGLGSHYRAIYIGADGIDSASTSFDSYLQWLVTSQSWWATWLQQYDVGISIFDGNTRVPTDAFFPPGMVKNGFVNWVTLAQRVAQVIHASPSDAGAPDADADGGTSQLPPIPKADAYIVFLPDGVNVDLGQGESTCANAGGYHDYDGLEPYAIIPPCGRYRLVVAHEMAEMATDPLPGQGWYSDGDLNNAGGEIADLCNELTTVDGQQVTKLWSNQDGDCEPQ